MMKPFLKEGSTLLRMSQELKRMLPMMRFPVKGGQATNLVGGRPYNK